MKKSIGIGLVAGLMALAIMALPAFASANAVSLRETSKTGAKLANGTGITGTSSNLKFETSEGNLECSENTIKGVLNKNAVDPAEGEITSGTFTGAGGAACNTTVLGGLVKATITAENFPWDITFTSNGTTGTSVIKGTNPKGTTANVAFNAVLKVGSTTVGTCTFGLDPVLDTFNLNTAMVDTISGQVFSLITSSGTCPKSGTLNGSFNIKTSGGTTVVATSP
jgi:hypothetical protein